MRGGLLLVLHKVYGVCAHAREPNSGVRTFGEMREVIEISAFDLTTLRRIGVGNGRRLYFTQ